MQQPAFWVAVGKIIWINVLLSGDNALVIALACRGLAPRQRLWGMILGAGAAVILRIIFTGIVATLDGAAVPQAGRRTGADRDRGQAAGARSRRTRTASQSASHLWAAVQIVVVADIVMSLDNVIAVAAAANGSVPLLILGLAISVPLIVAGAALIMALLTRLPILVWAGAALLGWIAGDVIATDPAIHPKLHALFVGPVRRQARCGAGVVRRGAAFCQSRQWRRTRLRRARRHRRAGRSERSGASARCKSTPSSPPRAAS